MRLQLLTASAALLLCAPAAMAQTNTPPGNTSATPPAANASVTAGNPAKLRNDVRDMLQKAGFTDIRVMPSSFMIHAKDQGGNPVIMSVSPDSVTEVAELGSKDANNSSGSTDQSSGMASEQQNGSQFISVNQNDKLSSNLVGLDVYNGSNQNVGQIKDIALGPRGRAQAYIVSVGGFLGAGQHYIAVNPSDIKVSYKDADKKWHATMNASKDQLKSAPQFQYNGQWNATKS